MNLDLYGVLSCVIILMIVLNIKLMSSPNTAVLGNRLGSIAMLGAIIVVLIGNGVIDLPLLVVSMTIGALIGLFLALKTTTLHIPQLVALLNGFGGGASLLVSLVLVFEKGDALDPLNRLAGMLAIVIGAVTLGGSLIAAAKLDGRIEQRPVIVKGHSVISLCTLAALVFLIALGFTGGRDLFSAGIVLTSISLFFGVLFTIRVGGADMPVVISLLNSYSGLAASICGFAVNNFLLVSVGAIVGAAGLILTNIMCRAMNRSLLDVLTGGTAPGKNKTFNVASQNDSGPDKTRVSSYKDVLHHAKKVVIVPGYGMALAQAQWKVKNLYDALLRKGVDVKFAIHPVAGRMPGHMNVLLAEVDISFESLCEMDQINPEFKDTDAVIVIGACDVVNPAAITAEGTPIYGMPILNVHEAKHVIVCNMDTKPGYSGVDNPLYRQENVEFLQGNAADTLDTIIVSL